jgi:diaminopimelate decarboxylase
MKFSTAIVAIAVSALSSSNAFAPAQSGRVATATATSPLFATIETAAPAETSVFLSAESAKACTDLAGSPVFAYSLEKLRDSADACLAFPNAYGLTVRYAMKACPNSAILKFFSSKGIHIDASSGFEVKRAMDAGIPAGNISLSTQELPENFADLIKLGVKINAW